MVLPVTNGRMGFMELDAKIEAILFYRAAPCTIAQLAQLLGVSAEEVAKGLDTLSARIATGGTRILRVGESAELVTAPECDEVLRALDKQEVAGSIGKAGAETLAIVLYRGPLTRAEIDYIRGVNSNFVLRNLQARGLVEAKQDQKTKKRLFSPTTDLLAHLGVTSRRDLPEYSEITSALAAYEQQAADA